MGTLNQETIQSHINDFETGLNEIKNPFPVEVFPVEVQNIIIETNKTLNFPVDFIGCSLLYASSVAIGNTYKAEIMPGWVEGVALYLALVGKAGTNKSHPLTFALQPIAEHDKRTFNQYKQKKTEYQNALVQSKADQTEIPEKPFWKKFLVSDYTPEGLAQVHNNNLRGVGVYADELAGWFKNFNRYNRGSETEFWLSNFSGKQIVIDRKSQEPILIAQPCISVCGTIQNQILTELGKDDRNQNGFIDRILFSIPENLKKEYWSETTLPPVIQANWAQIVENLFSLPLAIDETGNPQSIIMTFSDDAKEILKDWQHKNTDLANQPENEGFASIFSKLEIYVIRLALILELIDWATTQPAVYAINAKSANNATLLIEYFRNNAIYVYNYISNINKPIENLALDKKGLFDALPKEFTTEAGLIIANSFNIPERTFKRFISDTEYFQKLTHGKYEKLSLK